MSKKLLVLFFMLFISACSLSSHWLFYFKNGSYVIYEKDKWSCYYESLNAGFYVECFEKSTGDMDAFYAYRVEESK